jgi:hypothetical protein
MERLASEKHDLAYLASVKKIDHETFFFTEIS